MPNVNRLRVRQHRASGANNGLYEKGREDGYAKGKSEAEAAGEKRARDLTTAYQGEKDAMVRREEYLRRQLTAAQGQISTLEDALAKLTGFASPEYLAQATEEKAGLSETEKEALSARKVTRARDQGIQQEMWQGWPSFVITDNVRLFLGGKDGHGPFVDGQAHAFARSVRDLYEILLRPKWIGSIITDPIKYVKGIGVFKQGGSVVDATRIASKLIDDRY